MTAPKMTFQQFADLSAEAGFTSTPEQTEVDYWLGTTVADAVDGLHLLVETSGPPVDMKEFEDIVDVASEALLSALAEETPSVEKIRDAGLSLVSSTLRALAYLCRDDGTD